MAEGLRYAKSHEYVKPGGATVTVGISDFAQVRSPQAGLAGSPGRQPSHTPTTRPLPPCPQSELGDVVYVELPEVGSEVTAGQTFGVVESVKVRQGGTRARGAPPLLLTRLLGARRARLLSTAVACARAGGQRRLLPHQRRGGRGQLCPRGRPLQGGAAASRRGLLPPPGRPHHSDAQFPPFPLPGVQVNSEPFEGGWMMKVKLSNASQVDALMDAKAYQAHCEDGGH